MKVKGNGVKG